MSLRQGRRRIPGHPLGLNSRQQLFFSFLDQAIRNKTVALLFKRTAQVNGRLPVAQPELYIAGGVVMSLIVQIQFCQRLSQFRLGR